MLTLRTLGRFEALDDSGARVKFRTRKSAALCAYLVLRGGQDVPRPELYHMFWPGSSEADARNSLAVALSWLRGVVKSTEPGGDDIVRSNLFVASVAIEFIQSDVAQFEERIKASHRAEVTSERIDCLISALDLYRGPFTVGMEMPWAELERVRLEDHYFQAVIRLMDLAKKPSDIHRAINYAVEALRWDPKRKDIADRVRELRRLVSIRTESEAGGGRRLAQPSEQTAVLARALLDEEEAEVGPEFPDTTGGAVPLDSPFYIRRPTDDQLASAIDHHHSIVLIKGPRQIGKTSLLARGLATAHQAGSESALMDFQAMPSEDMTDSRAFTKRLIDEIATSLEIDSAASDGHGLVAIERFFRKHILTPGRGHFVWALDEVDRLFELPFGSDFFGMLRSWHNKRALEPAGPWPRLTVVICYSADAQAFIKDPNQSPFNVGTRLSLEDFSIQEVAELNTRYGKPLKNVLDLEGFYKLLNGHPHLSRLAFDEIAYNGATYAELRTEALDDGGVFAPELQRLVGVIEREPALRQGLQEILRGDPRLSVATFQRLRTLGLIVGKSTQTSSVRCELYRHFFTKFL